MTAKEKAYREITLIEKRFGVPIETAARCMMLAGIESRDIYLFEAKETLRLTLYILLPCLLYLSIGYLL